jgi:hypothetical protein
MYPIVFSAGPPGRKPPTKGTLLSDRNPMRVSIILMPLGMVLNGAIVLVLDGTLCISLLFSANAGSRSRLWAQGQGEYGTATPQGLGEDA